MFHPGRINPYKYIVWTGVTPTAARDYDYGLRHLLNNNNTTTYMTWLTNKRELSDNIHNVYCVLNTVVQHINIKNYNTVNATQ